MLTTFRFKLLLLTPLLFLPLPFQEAHAQKTNVEVMQELALECLDDVPDSSRQFIIAATNAPVFIRSALVTNWQKANYTLFIADSLLTTPPRIPSLSFSVENSSISYERLKRKRVSRKIEQTVHHTFTSPEGILLSEAACTRDFTDTVSRNDLDTLESEAYPQTQAPHPKGGWVKRYLEPAVLATATTLGVYLFFTLRSDSNDDDT